MMAIAAERSAIASYRVIPSLASIPVVLAGSAAVFERKTPMMVTQKPMTVARTPNTLTTSAHLVAHSRTAFIGFRYKSPGISLSWAWQLAPAEMVRPFLVRVVMDV